MGEKHRFLGAGSNIDQNRHAVRPLSHNVQTQSVSEISEGLGQSRADNGATVPGSGSVAAGVSEEKVMAVEEYEDCYVTEDGEIVPKDEAEQRAEAKRGPNAQEEIDVEADV